MRATPRKVIGSPFLIIARSAVSARLVVAWLLRCAAARRFSGLPRAIAQVGAPRVPAPRTAWLSACGSVTTAMILLQRLLFSAPLGEPDVLVGHLVAGSVASNACLRCVDELAEEVELLLVLGEVGAVGGELVAGQARVAAVADLPGREHAPAVGQHPVGALVELEQLVEVARVELELAAVGGDLLEAQELALVGLGRVWT